MYVQCSGSRYTGLKAISGAATLKQVCLDVITENK